MIRSFADKIAAAIWHLQQPKKLPTHLRDRALAKLQLLHAATTVMDLAVPPGNRLEALRGDLAGYWSIRINDQWRLVFRFVGNDAYDVMIIDYH
jgi:toxin HigB-1